jgi:sec-independent protein translocase protein TatA
MPLAFLNNIGMGELLVILAIVLVVFGAKRLPEIARSIGQSVSEFKKGINNAKEEVATTLQTEEAQQKAKENAKPTSDTIKKA